MSIAPPRTEDWIPVVGLNGYQFILDLYNKSVGTESVIEIASSMASSGLRFSDSSGRFDDTVLVILADRTTTGNETLICTAALTVTLNAHPDDLERVRIKSTTTGTVTISGSHNIDGDASVSLIAQYEVMEIVYSADQGEWYII